MIDSANAAERPLSAAIERIRSDVRARRALSDGMSAPSKEFRKLRSRLERRQAVGVEPSVAANDNQPWPLALQLRRDGNEVLLDVAERYRTIWDAANHDVALLGSGPSIEAASLLQITSFDMTNGKEKRHGVRRVRSAPPVSDGNFKMVPSVTDDDEANPTTHALATFKRKPARPVPKKWHGDNALIAHIDSRRILKLLQDALGPLLDVFEDAVLHGETLSAIGEARGGNSVSSGPIGKALVIEGLQSVREVLARIDREHRAP